MKGDNARKETSTPSSRILNRSGDVGGAKASNELDNSLSASGEIRAHDPAPSGAQSSTNPTTSPLRDSAASILRNALTISGNLPTDVDMLAASFSVASATIDAVREIDRLMRQALDLVEETRPAAGTIPLYRPDPITPPSADLAEQLRQMEKTNAELAGDPLAQFEDGGAGSGR